MGVVDRAGIVADRLGIGVGERRGNRLEHRPVHHAVEAEPLEQLIHRREVFPLPGADGEGMLEEPALVEIETAVLEAGRGLGRGADRCRGENDEAGDSAKQTSATGEMHERPLSPVAKRVARLSPYHSDALRGCACALWWCAVFSAPAEQMAAR